MLFRSRNGATQSQEVDMKMLVPGDVIYLSAGDMIPYNSQSECRSVGCFEIPIDFPPTGMINSVLLFNICITVIYHWNTFGSSNE